jgi:hypothetical protein
MGRLDVRLHAGQMVIHRDPRPNRVAVMGRRFGKTRLVIWEAVLDALSWTGPVDPLSPETVLVALPTLKQARKLVWGPLVSLATGPLSAHVESINRTECYLKFRGKPPIVVAGANDSEGDRLRGLRVWRAKLDEYQDFKPGVLDTVLSPAMADTPGSRLLVTGTPKGKLNHLYQLFQRADQWPDKWASFNLPTTANPFIPAGEAENARLVLPPRLYRQEWQASFEDYPGKIYSELGPEALVDHDPVGTPFDLVVAGIDWGDVHPAIVVLGRVSDTWVVLDGWEPIGPDGGPNTLPVPDPVFDSEIGRLFSRWGVQAAYCDPSRPSSILRVRGLLPQTVAGYNPIEEGITQVHSLIWQNRLRFGPSPMARRLYDQCLAYRRWINPDGVITDRVEPGQMDHLVDALRYALAVPEPPG